MLQKDPYYYGILKKEDFIGMKLIEVNGDLKKNQRFNDVKFKIYV